MELIPILQEIPFLRGYYLSKLGRFAFTMEDRIAWTNEAEKLFRQANIPAQFYCNPNPTAAPEDALQIEHSNSIDSTSLMSSNTSSRVGNNEANRHNDNKGENNPDDDDDNISSSSTFSTRDENIAHTTKNQDVYPHHS